MGEKNRAASDIAEQQRRIIRQVERAVAEIKAKPTSLRGPFKIRESVIGPEVEPHNG